MNLEPSENTKIYGMEIFFNEFVGLYKQKRIPNTAQKNLYSNG